MRNLLTNPTPTFATSLFFSFVSLGAMFLYPALLPIIVLGSVPIYVAISGGMARAFCAAGRQRSGNAAFCAT
jgi:ABC-type bacteriocin/lantibiotic exporter with double-glycine peptidase domain